MQKPREALANEELLTGVGTGIIYRSLDRRGCEHHRIASGILRRRYSSPRYPCIEFRCAALQASLRAFESSRIELAKTNNPAERKKKFHHQVRAQGTTRFGESLTGGNREKENNKKKVEQPPKNFWRRSSRDRVTSESARAFRGFPQDTCKKNGSRGKKKTEWNRGGSS